MGLILFVQYVMDLFYIGSLNEFDSMWAGFYLGSVLNGFNPAWIQSHVGLTQRECYSSLVNSNSNLILEDNFEY